MAVYSVAGSKFEIGAALAQKSSDFVAGDFTAALAEGKTVGEAESFGSIGDPWETEDFTSVTDARTRVIKTVRKGSSFELTCGADPTDAGQLALRAAAASTSYYAFRYTMADKPAAGAAPKNSTRTFLGTVMDAQDDPSGKIGKVKFIIQINSNIVVTHASAS